MVSNYEEKSKDDSVVDYSNCALIVWDLQYGITSRTLNLGRLVSNTKHLLDACHRASRPVFYSQGTGLPYEYQSPYIRYWLSKRGINPRVPRMVEGTHDWSIMAEVAPKEGDFTIKKNTQSFFVGTNVEQLLRNMGVDVVIIAGVSTEVGVEATARHAAQLGFIPVIPEDAVGSSDEQLQQASFAVMRKLFEVKSTEEIIKRILSDATPSSSSIGR